MKLCIENTLNENASVTIKTCKGIYVSEDTRDFKLNEVRDAMDGVLADVDKLNDAVDFVVGKIEADTADMSLLDKLKLAIFG